MKHGDTRARKFRHAIRLAAEHMPAHMPAGLFLTDPDRTSDPAKTVSALPDGIGVVFRHFGSAQRYATGRQLARLCQKQRRTLLVSSDLELAHSIGAHGVHWPAREAHRLARARQTFPINTMSVHNVHELRIARALRVDAVLVSAVFSSQSPSAPQAIGTPRLAALSAHAGRPVYALGGITGDNVERVSRLTGFASISGLGDVFG